MPIVRFGDTAPHVYDFTASHVHLQGASPRFGQVVTETKRLAGMSGGVDEYGFDPAPQAIGSIRQALILEAQDHAEMDDLRDALMALVGWPKLRLYRENTDPEKPLRSCFARVDDIQLGELDHEPVGRLWQQATVIWQSNDPLWRSSDADYVYDGEDALYDEPEVVYGGVAPIEASGTETDDTVNNAGVATIRPVMTVTVPAGESATDIKIQRIVSATVVDEVSYDGTLAAGTTLVIDADGGRVLLNSGNGYDNNFDFLHPQWMRLLPGDNTLRVVMANAGDRADVTVSFDRGYF